jgi:hypothetical protein
MTVLCICAGKGSPGVTTLACAIGAVWPERRRIILAECDPSGGDLAAKFGLSAKRGMASMMLDVRRANSGGSVDSAAHLQTLPGGLEVLAGPTGAGASITVDGALEDCLSYLASDANSETDFVLDCGRILPRAMGQVAAIRAARQVIVVARPTVEGLASTRWIAERLTRSDSSESTDTNESNPLHGDGSSAGLVLVGEGPVAPSQAASAFGIQVLATIPWDPRGSSALRGEPLSNRRLGRSPLINTVRHLVSSQIICRPAVSNFVEQR